jgi:hypothetical protein
MVTEKLAKALLTKPGSDTPAPPSHVLFVRTLQLLKWRPDVWRSLGYTRAEGFRRYIDSLLDLARKIERLSPDQAGFGQPNPGYPWRDPAKNQVLAPVEYEFAEFDLRDVKMMKIDRLIQDLLRLAI